MAFQRDKYLWLCFILTLILSGVFAFVDLFEYVNIMILQRTEGYPFGGEGPWYYKSKELYATLCLVFGLIFFIALLVSVWSLIKDKKKLMIITCIFTIVLIILQIINGQVA
jgi:hypothetical protein